MFFPVYILIQISFTELWEVLCNKDINQLMDEAEHDITELCWSRSVLPCENRIR